MDAIDRIRAGCEILTMVSTGGANDMTIEERTTGLEAKPDISGVESGSMNFGDETFITPPPAGRGIVERAQGRGSRWRSRPSTSATWSAPCAGSSRACSMAPLRINLVFGVPGGIDASPEALDAMLRPLPPETFWTVTCIGRHHQRMLGAGAAQGGAGNPHRARGRRLHRQGRAGAVERAPWSRWPSAWRGRLGREVATQDQTKELLGLG